MAPRAGLDLQRRLLGVPGIVQINTWGGTTKEYDVEVDLHKLDAYNVTLPQVITALGNANINVGGRDHQYGPAVGEYPRRRLDEQRRR